jgi:hypothetical protein
MTGRTFLFFSFVLFYCIGYRWGNLFQFSIHVYVCICGLGVYVGWVVCVMRDACAGWCVLQLKLKLRCVKDEGYKINTITIYNV